MENHFSRKFKFQGINILRKNVFVNWEVACVAAIPDIIHDFFKQILSMNI